MINVGTTVEWDTMDGDTERGEVVAVAGDRATVRYGPWGDVMVVPLARLRLWTRKETP